MSSHRTHARRLVLPVAFAALVAAPLHAQGTAGMASPAGGAAPGAAATAGTSTAGSSVGADAGAGGAMSAAQTMSTRSDTVVHETKEDKGFPWGLLGLLGLLGLMKRPQKETVVQREPLRDTTTRPGDPNYRV